MSELGGTEGSSDCNLRTLFFPSPCICLCGYIQGVTCILEGGRMGGGVDTWLEGAKRFLIRGLEM